jgi:hypothetical protein
VLYEDDQNVHFVVCVSASGFKNWWLKSVWILLFPALCPYLLLRGMDMGRGEFRRWWRAEKF